MIMDYKRGGKQKEIYTELEVEYVVCPLCNKTKYKEIYRERGVLGIVRCENCDLIYVNPRLKNPEMTYWGDVDNYLEEARLIFEGKAKHHRDKNYIDDLKLIYKYKPGGNFLDIGTNMGFFLRKARGWKWNLYGVEPSVALSDIARKYFGLNVKTAFLEEAHFPNEFFDVVTMTDVFEHLSQPGRVLAEVYRILKADGILFIKVPNGLFNLFKFYSAKMTGHIKNYDIFDSYEHIVHYSSKTLRLMLNKSGFKVIKVYIGKPIQLPVWHKYVGQYYQYPSPWLLDFKRQFARIAFYILSLIEYRMRLNKIGYLAPNIIAIATKNEISHRKNNCP